MECVYKLTLDEVAEAVGEWLSNHHSIDVIVDHISVTLEEDEVHVGW